MDFPEGANTIGPGGSLFPLALFLAFPKLFHSFCKSTKAIKNKQGGINV